MDKEDTDYTTDFTESTAVEEGKEAALTHFEMPGKLILFTI
jgi:hypothetical protein